MNHLEAPGSVFRPDDLIRIARRLILADARIDSSTAVLLGAMSLGLGLLANGLFNSASLGLNFPLWLGAVAACLLIAAHRSHTVLERNQLGLLAFALVLACLVAGRASPALQAVNLLAAFFLLLVAVALPRQTTVRRTSFASFAFSLVVGMWSLAVGALRIAILLPWPRAWSSPARHGMAVGRTLLLTLPLILIFGGLFVAADAVFEEQVSRLFSFDLGIHLGHLRSHFWWTFAGAVGSAGLFWCALGFEAPAAPEASMPERHRLRTLEVGFVLGALALLFTAFVAIQLRYLFGGRELVETTLDLTFAEYARRGFFELVAVASLLIPVLLLINWARRRSEKTTFVYRLLAVVLTVLLGVVMASALQRLDVYTDTFGLTELRFYSAFFLACTAAVVVCFLATILRERIGEFIWGSAFIAFAGLIVLNGLNPDALIVRTNLNHFDDGGDFDAPHAGGLSADAVPTLIDELGRLEAPDRCIVSTAILATYDEGASDVRGWTYGRAEARRATENQTEELLKACSP